MRQPADVLRIGILNLMHDKLDTRARFLRVLEGQGINVEVTFYYPKDHYKERPVPPEVAKYARPLDLTEVKKLDGFIVTGAPLERLSFDEITYIDELQGLFLCLEKYQIEQLYVCWGAMAALNYFYGIEKYLLAQKVFGVYPQEILAPSKLLHGLKDGFLAPHARYADIDLAQVRQRPELQISANSLTGHAFLIEAQKAHQTFLFSHLEYGRQALEKEYQREVAAYPEQKAYLARPTYASQALRFSWAKAQQLFFKNWLTLIATRKKAKNVIKN